MISQYLHEERPGRCVAVAVKWWGSQMVSVAMTRGEVAGLIMLVAAVAVQDMDIAPDRPKEITPGPFLLHTKLDDVLLKAEG